MRLLPAPAVLLALLLAAPPGHAQEPPVDASDLVDGLLAGLLGFGEMTGPELQSEVAQIGGIPFRRDVPLAYMTRPEVERYVRAMLDEEYPEARARADERTLRALDLLPPGVDLRATRERLLLQNIAGFYDERPDRRKLFAVSANQTLTPTNQLVMAHELRHALQDQYVDVHALLPDALGEFDDRRLALLGLFEGDATLVMEQFLLKRVPGAESMGDELGELSIPAMADLDAPPILRDELVLPYVVGRAFARAVGQHGGPGAMREAWAHPPASTEQVLHPEKYFAHEAPRPVELAWSPEGGRQLSSGVLGEVYARTLLGEGNEEAAAGWGGDLYRSWDVGGHTLLVWRTVWDTPKDADEFVAALRARYASTGRDLGALSGFSRFEARGFQRALAARPGAVVLAASDDPTLLLRAMAALSRP